MITTILQAMRPRQWSKNLFVFAGLLFTLDRQHPVSDYVKVVLAFALFCILSGSVYIVNDILDVERDRLHEKKSQRPIASGRLAIRTAWIVATLLCIGSLMLSFALDFRFGSISLAYLGLITAYSLGLKKIVILDVLVIAGGFVLRAAAGAAAINVSVSPWLFVCTVLLALFLGLAKRRQELLVVQKAQEHRPVLEQYSIPLLDQLINIVASTTITAYALYTFFSRTGAAHPYMMITLPFVIYGVFRYLFLIHNNLGAESPETLVITDKPLLVCIILWALTAGLIIGLGK